MKKILSALAIGAAIFLSACGNSANDGYELMKDTVVRGMQQYTVKTEVDSKEDVQKIANELEEKALKANTKPDSMWINFQTKSGAAVAKIKVAYTDTGLSQTGLKEKQQMKITME